MSSETTLIPKGVLGQSVDGLLLEREDLAARHRELYQAWQAAEKAVGPARRADTEAYAEALRTPGSKDPGSLNTELAKQALDDAHRALLAIAAAFAKNQAEIVAVLSDRAAELHRVIDDEVSAVRGEALSHLEAASQGLVRFTELESLRAWCQKPLDGSGDKLRTFVPEKLHVAARGERGGEFLTANAVFVLLGERLEHGAVDNENLRAAHDAGVVADRIERIDGRALSAGGRVKIADLAKINLCRVRVIRGSYGVDLVCTTEEAAGSLTELLRSARADIDNAFDSRTPHVWASDVVKQRVDGVAVEKSKTLPQNQAAKAEYENMQEVNHLRELQEREAEQDAA